MSARNNFDGCVVLSEMEFEQNIGLGTTNVTGSGKFGPDIH